MVRSTDAPLRVQRRRAIERDRELIEDLHVAALGPVALVGYGWPAIKLRQQFRSEIQLENCYVILVDGVDAGYISIADRRSFWYIDAIAIAPKYQRRGVGTRALRDILEHAGVTPVRLNVLHINRAKSLYTRLGFRTIGADGQRQIMEWRAAI